MTTLGACLLLTALGGQTWSVSPTKPADFTDLADAVAAAADGDVLLVDEGTYPPFATDKALTVLAVPLLPPDPPPFGPVPEHRPRITGPSSVSGAASFTIAGFALDGFDFTDIRGPLRVDDCSLGSAAPALTPYAGLRVERCDDVVLSRLSVEGEDQFPGSGDGGAGLVLVDATAVLVDAHVRGGPGGVDCPSPAGGDAIVVDGGSLLLAGSSAFGGAAGEWCGLGQNPGPPGLALRASAALVTVTGSSTDLLAGTSTGPAASFSDCTVQVGGVDVFSGPVPYATSNTSLTELTIPRPYVEILGLDVPGASRRLRAFAPAGTPMLVALSPLPSLTALPLLVDGTIYVEPATVVLLATLVANGQDLAETLTLPLPPTLGLEGSVIPFQLFAPAVTGIGSAPVEATNPADVVLRFDPSDLGW